MLPPLEPPRVSPEYPPSFEPGDCAGPLSQPHAGAEVCVTLDQLIDENPILSVAGGFQVLGTEARWRCPTITELIADNGCSLGEGCCVSDAHCGPVERPAPPSGAAGAAGEPSAGYGGAADTGHRDLHTCCYYVVTVCGV